jgi:autotransporter strand-loop-strand O-heptosyltransferase
MNILKINDVEYDMSVPNGIEFKRQYIRSFGDVPHPEINVKWNHINGFHLNLEADTDDTFVLQVFDDSDLMIYQSEIKGGMFCKLYREYFNGLKYKIYKDDLLVKEETINFKNKRVFINFESSSLGDSIAWMPYCEEFRKKHECEVIVSTFLNFLFENNYPNLTFVGRNTTVENIYGMFNVGWFYDENKEPEYAPAIPLQKAATNILGLEFEEIHSKVYFEPKDRPYEQKYVCIATDSTAGCKLWNNPTGWDELVDYLINKGYIVVNISKDAKKMSGVLNLEDDSLDNTMNVIYHSDFVVGLSSGLSWLTWGLGKHIVMISNFTEYDHEFTTNCTRITNLNVCNGCWNNPMFKFDKGDWYWCPEHKGTDRQFECHKSITSEMVINKIQHLLV